MLSKDLRTNGESRYSTISRQRSFHGQRVHLRLQSTTARVILLWGKRSFPERDCGASHQKPSGANENVDALHHEQVEANDTHLLVALCNAAHERRRKHNAKKRRGPMTFGMVFGSKCHAQVVTFPCLWMSYLCVGQCTSKRPGFSQVETTCKTQRVPRAFTESCTVCSLGAKSTHRPRLTPIPCEIQRFF